MGFWGKSCYCRPGKDPAGKRGVLLHGCKLQGTFFGPQAGLEKGISVEVTSIEVVFICVFNETGNDRSRE